jgi:hypothetical protein
VTTLFDLDFSVESPGTYLHTIDAEWEKTNSVNLGITSNGRLSPLDYTGAAYRYLHAGKVHWEIGVYADDVSAMGPVWYFGVGNSGTSQTAGVVVTFDFTNARWKLTEEYTLKGTVSDDWWTEGATRQLIIDWDPDAGTMTLTVMDGATEIGTSTVTGITSDGDYAFLGAKWNDIAYTTVTLTDMMATDGAAESTSTLPLNAYVSGAWVTGTLKVYTGGAWTAGQLKRFNGTSWD